MIFTLALAAPPAGVDLDDYDRWDAGAAKLLAGPPGCWVLGGRAEITLTGLPAVARVGRGDAREDRWLAAFDGVLQDGEWLNLSYTLVPKDDPTRPAGLDVPLLPTIGRFRPGVLQRLNPAPSDELSVETGGEAARNLVEEMFSRLGSSTSVARWRDDLGGLELLQEVSLDEARRADPVKVRTFFPGGGDADRLDALFPRRMREGEFPFVATIYDLQLHLRSAVVNGARVPSADSLSFGVGVMGFTFGYEQALTWERVSPCG